MDAEYRVQKVALILWKDAYSDYDMVTLETAKEQLKMGMPLFTSGVLVDDSSGTVTVAQDVVATYPMVRNIRKIPKCCIVGMWLTDVKWNENIDNKEELIYDANPTVFGLAKMATYDGWKDGEWECEHTTTTCPAGVAASPSQ